MAQILILTMTNSQTASFRHPRKGGNAKSTIAAGQVRPTEGKWAMRAQKWGSGGLVERVQTDISICGAGGRRNFARPEYFFLRATCRCAIFERGRTVTGIRDLGEFSVICHHLGTALWLLAVRAGDAEQFRTSAG